MGSTFALTPAQQAAAVDRVGESLALVSGAGCGKTFVLSRRYSQLLQTGPGEPSSLSRLIALTFTEKAALQMSQRVREELSRLAGESSGERRNKLLRWLEELPEARISTIHSFCASLLRSHAIDAGVDPAFAVCSDNLLAERMVSEAADEALLIAVEGSHAGAADLLSRYSFSQLVERIAGLLDSRTAYAAPDHADPDRTLARWCEQLRAARDKAWARMEGDARIRTLLSELQVAPCSEPDDRLNDLRDRLLDAADALLHHKRKRTPEMFARLTESPGGSGSAKCWGGAENVRHVRQSLKALTESFEPYAIYAEDLCDTDREAAEAIATLTSLIADANTAYTAEKRRRGMLDFTDLLEQAHNLLAGNPGAGKRLRKQIDQLLIDECQDTDSYQIRLLEHLVHDDGGDAAQPPPSGRLFVVGDAKQSIYRFRGAQVEVFEDLCRRMGEGNREKLDLSFRTHPAGVAFINELFAPLMGADYETIGAHRQECPEHPSVEILLADGSAESPITSAADADKAQAALTAQRIREIIDGSERLVWDRDAGQWRRARWGDIAILFARMTRSLDYERELQRRDIPYYVLAGSGFFRRQEVYDVLNALRVVDNPFDDIAFVGVLRSSLFGLDDNALLAIARAVSPPYLPGIRTAACLSGESIPEDLPEGAKESIGLAASLLTDLHREKDAVSIDRLMERLVHATGYEATLLAQFQGRRMLGNVRLLIDKARTASAEGVALADFLAQTEELILHQGRYEQASVVGEHEDVVRIMTIHKSKGLEFPIVVLPDLNAGVGPGRKDILIRRDWGLTWDIKPAGHDEVAGEKETPGPLSARIAEQMEADDQARENLRKWYVGATRHKDHLIFVGADWRDRNGDLRGSGCFLRQIDETLGITPALEGGDEAIEYADGQYRATVRRIVPSPPGAAGGKQTRGAQLLEEAGSSRELARSVIQTGLRGRMKNPLPLVGPLSPEIGMVDLAVTALGDYEYCPMLYRWQYELRVPAPAVVRQKEGESVTATWSSGVDAATLGTFYHRCMELLDVRAPQTAEALATQVAAEMELADTLDVDAVTAELGDMVKKLRDQALWGALASAKREFRELDFCLELPPARIRGQIDLLYEDSGGVWHIVDYKSNRLGEHSAAEHARRYELQMLAYAAAVAGHVGTPPADATVVFLRSGQMHRMELTPPAMEAAKTRIENLAGHLIVARRGGQFETRQAQRCAVCPYGRLCRPVGGG